MNMESHIEYHIYPLVPFHAQPNLHEGVKDKLPRPYHGLWEGNKELLLVLFRQKRDMSVYIQCEIPIQTIE
jgi:fatty acid desaturase